MARQQDESLLSPYAKPYPPKPSSREQGAIQDYLNLHRARQEETRQREYDAWEASEGDGGRFDMPSNMEGIRKNPLTYLERLQRFFESIKNPYDSIKDRLGN